MIGAGGVGQAIATRLHEIAQEVCLVHRPYQTLHVPYSTVTSWEAVPWEKVRGIFLCVKDRQIASTAEAILPFVGPIEGIVHTAGSIPLSEIAQYYGEKAGVLYPLQTFTPGQPISWGSFPIVWEGPPLIRRWATLLAGTAEKVHYVDSALRLRLHIGAVFAANFVNALFHIADRLAQPAGGWKLYLPLAQKVVEKLSYLSPAEAQTGPARRGDTLTLAKHEAFLQAEMPELLPLYQSLSAYIQMHAAQSSRQ